MTKNIAFLISYVGVMLLWENNIVALTGNVKSLFSNKNKYKKHLNLCIGHDIKALKIIIKHHTIRQKTLTYKDFFMYKALYRLINSASNYF